MITRNVLRRVNEESYRQRRSALPHLVSTVDLLSSTIEKRIFKYLIFYDYKSETNYKMVEVYYKSGKMFYDFSPLTILL